MCSVLRNEAFKRIRTFWAAKDEQKRLLAELLCAQKKKKKARVKSERV